MILKALEVQFLPNWINVLFDKTIFAFNSQEIKMPKSITWKIWLIFFHIWLVVSIHCLDAYLINVVIFVLCWECYFHVSGASICSCLESKRFKEMFEKFWMQFGLMVQPLNWQSGVLVSKHIVAESLFFSNQNSGPDR